MAVYAFKDPAPWLRTLAGACIHQAEALELYALDRGLVGVLAERLERRVALAVSVMDRHLDVTVGGETLEGVVERRARGG